eukprot:UN14332
MHKKEVFDEFIKALTVDGPCFGVMLFTFRLEDYGRIYDKLVYFGYLLTVAEQIKFIRYSKGSVTRNVFIP